MMHEVVFTLKCPGLDEEIAKVERLTFLLRELKGLLDELGIKPPTLKGE